ncbi:S-layer homology domain-containing protein [Candidatus Dojkabacteria bacterium]|nr:S-layer homology domain-containing protein [Candidatus Dojkabacteria bacterium]
MKPLLKIFLISLLLATSIVTSFAAFPDVQPENYFHSAISYVETNGIVSGFSDGTFKPENNITRGEFLKIIINSYFNNPELQNCTNTGYYDVDANNTFVNYICFATSKGIINGFADNTFRTNSEIQFGAAAKIIANTFEMNPDLTLITQQEKFKPHIIRLEEKTAIPTSINYIEQVLTRAELAEIIYRVKTGIQKESKKYEDFPTVSIQGITDKVPTPTITPSPIKVTVIKPGATPISSIYICNCAKTCSEITTCTEAYFQLQSCGCSARDNDGDGIPCTNICL